MPLEPVSIQAGNGASERLRLRYVLVVWGEKYIDRYFESAFPTHLSANNLPALSRFHDLSFVILTRRQDRKAFENHRRYAGMKRLGPVEFILIDDLISHPGVFTVTLTLAFTRAIREAGEAATKINFILMNADFILADGTLATVARHLLAGSKAVLTASPRAIAEQVAPVVAALPAGADGSITLSPRDAVKMVLAAPHAMVFAKQPDQDVLHTTVPNQYFWFVDRDTLLARSFLMFMLAIRPRSAGYRATSYCDYSLVADLVDEQDISVIDDSDDGFILELQSGNQEADTVRLGALKESDAAAHLAEWTTDHHRSIAQRDLVFHSAALPSSLPEARRTAKAYVDRLLSALPPAIDAHTHPYWIGGIQAWQYHRPGVPLPAEVDTTVLDEPAREGAMAIADQGSAIGICRGRADRSKARATALGRNSSAAGSQDLQAVVRGRPPLERHVACRAVPGRPDTCSGASDPECRASGLDSRPSHTRRLANVGLAGMPGDACKLARSGRRSAVAGRQRSYRLRQRHHTVADLRRLQSRASDCEQRRPGQRSSSSAETNRWATSIASCCRR